ncbi:hypothetical protein JXA12_01175 [Candidatus Woesearchaeota archaeon]|nr:hypothetical protein [Candidatus Woesearchaeota archaeon]
MADDGLFYVVLLGELPAVFAHDSLVVRVGELLVVVSFRGFEDGDVLPVFFAERFLFTFGTASS